MANIIIFGAGGKAGRATVKEALGRGHQVTAVVRDPAKYQDLAESGARVVAGDATDEQHVATLAAGHDAAVSAGYDPAADPAAYFAGAARAIVASGIARPLFIGIGTVLEVAPGVPLHDTPDFPEAHRTFSLGHAAELDVLRDTAPVGQDWLVVAPPPVVLDAEAARTGEYRIGGTQVIPAETFSYADLAVALVDEIEAPKHHRVLVAIG